MQDEIWAYLPTLFLGSRFLSRCPSSMHPPRDSPLYSKRRPPTLRGWPRWKKSKKLGPISKIICLYQTKICTKLVQIQNKRTADSERRPKKRRVSILGFLQKIDVEADKFNLVIFLFIPKISPKHVTWTRFYFTAKRTGFFFNYEKLLRTKMCAASRRVDRCIQIRAGKCGTRGNCDFANSWKSRISRLKHVLRSLFSQFLWFFFEF